MVRIAIIDTGIDIKELQNKQIIDTRFIIHNGDLVEISHGYSYPLISNHGTICAQILEEYMPTNIEYRIIDINIASMDVL